MNDLDVKTHLTKFACGIETVVLAPTTPKYLCQGDQFDTLYAARLCTEDQSIKIFLVDHDLHDQIQYVFAGMRSSLDKEDAVDRIEQLFDRVTLVVETVDLLNTGLLQCSCSLVFDQTLKAFSEDELILAINRLSYLENIFIFNDSLGMEF